MTTITYEQVWRAFRYANEAEAAYTELTAGEYTPDQEAGASEHARATLEAAEELKALYDSQR